MSNEIRIASVDDVAEGEGIVIDSKITGTDDDVALIHSDNGEFYALDDTCSHEEASLAEGWIEGEEVECPLHSARFCLKTGAALCMPATEPVNAYAVEVRDDEVYLIR